MHVTLNMTTVLADLGRHEEALEKAQEAVRMLTRAERMGRAADPSLLSAAYHNLAVQQERLGATKGHVRSYRAAVLHARKGGTKSHPMASFMEAAYSNARSRSTQAYSVSAGSSRGLPPVQPPPRRKPHGGSRGGLGKPRVQTSPPRQAGPSLNLDDIYSGSVPAAAPGSVPVIPPIGQAAAEGGEEDALREHGPRSAESAQIG